MGVIDKGKQRRGKSYAPGRRGFQRGIEKRKRKRLRRRGRVETMLMGDGDIKEKGREGRI